ncbi:MAG TPA: AAA family ATPase [Patescibacteria group bacterium]
MTIIGHSKIIKILDRSIKKEKVAQAYIFSGPMGVGKFTVALNFSKKLLGIGPSTGSISSLQARSGRVNPDLIIITPEVEEKKGILKKKDIKIEKIRELQHLIALSSSGGQYRVVIIDDADRLNKASQNALLKTLEEPNRGLVLILVVQDEKKILPTIMSRCQKIKFGTVMRSDLEKIIPSGTKEKEEIIFWSLGRPGLMVELSKNNDELDFRIEALGLLKGLFTKNIPEKFSFAEKLSKDINLAEKTLNIWMVALRESLLGEKRLINFSQSGSLKLIDEIGESLGIIKNTNSNAKLILENLFLNF